MTSSWCNHAIITSIWFFKSQRYRYDIVTMQLYVDSMSSKCVSNRYRNGVITSRHRNYAVMANCDNIVATLNRHRIDVVYKYLISVKMLIRHRRDVIVVSIRCHHDLSNRHRNGVVASWHRNDAVTANLTMSILFIMMISWQHWLDIESILFTNIRFL